MDVTIKFMSSKSQFEEFFQSTVWDDIKTILDDWLKNCHEILEDSAGTMQIKDVNRFQGIVRGIREFANLEVFVLPALEMAQEDQK